MNDSIHSPYRDAVEIIYRDGTGSSLERQEQVYLISGNEPIHTVKQGENIQSIAFQYYSDSGLWYKIADVNDITNPFDDVTQGMQLIIPES